MGRNRVYASSAERQRAYRLRAAAGREEVHPVPSARRRAPSRPARLAALCTAAEELRQEYEAWLESLPETLQDSSQGKKLAETVEQLEAVVDLLAAIDPARGFGRD